ncbi:MAG TPA: hypothetical protein VGG11_09415 [Xanthobacteraceae bacterium]|jgi:hypothetical protein
MKLNSELVDRTLNQIDAQAVPEDAPMFTRLKDVFGDHTFFLDSSGLNIVEPVKGSPQTGNVVNLARWGGTEQQNLVPHSPEPTNVTVQLTPVQ